MAAKSRNAPRNGTAATGLSVEYDPGLKLPKTHRQLIESIAMGEPKAESCRKLFPHIKHPAQKAHQILNSAYGSLYFQQVKSELDSDTFGLSKERSLTILEEIAEDEECTPRDRTTAIAETSKIKGFAEPTKVQVLGVMAHFTDNGERL